MPKFEALNLLLRNDSTTPTHYSKKSAFLLLETNKKRCSVVGYIDNVSCLWTF